jgi:4-amino-4-deoxy-L-arabinose transferase-like glycosyltransferase
MSTRIHNLNRPDSCSAAVKSRRIAPATVVMLVILSAAFAFRVAYAINIGPGVDEYITTLAVEQVHRTGVPVLPSGFAYDHGVLFVYIDAVITWLVGTSWLGLRLPSVLCGVMLVALIYRMGKEWFSSRTGIIGALILALMPEMIARGAQVRMQSLLQLLLLIAAFSLYEGIAHRDDQARRLVAVAAISSALFTHLLAIPFVLFLLLGVMGTWFWLYQRRERQLSMRCFPWLEILGLIVPASFRWWLRARSGPWGVGGRFVIDPEIWLNAEYILTHLLGWSYQFITWPYLILSIVITAGALVLFLRIIRRSSLHDDIPRAFLIFFWLSNLVTLALFAGLHSPGYVVPLIPFWALLGAAEIDLLTCMVDTSPRFWPRTAILGIVLIAIAALIVPHTLDGVSDDPFELDEALASVRDHAVPEDLILSTMPVPTYIELGQVDYYAREQGAEAVISPDGYQGIWLGTPVIQSANELEHVLRGGRRVWLLIDLQSWNTHLSPEYKRPVVELAPCNDEFAGILVCVTNK